MPELRHRLTHDGITGNTINQEVVISCERDGVWLGIPNMGTCTEYDNPDGNMRVVLEFVEGRWKLHVWANPYQEDPETFVITRDEREDQKPSKT